MSRRKQANPKPVKVEEDAMQKTGSSEEVNGREIPLVLSHPMLKECDNFDEDADGLVIDAANLSSPMSQMSDSAANSFVNRLADSVSSHSSMEPMVESDSKMTASIDYTEMIFEEAVMEVCTETPEKSRANSISSNTSDKDNISVSDSISYSEMPHHLSSVSLADVMVQEPLPLSDGNSSLRNSVSKSRKKSDRILPLPGSNGEENFVCPVCQEVLPNNHEFTRHIRSHNTTTSASTINTCTICEKVLSSQSSLDRHMLVHSGERPFTCRLCNMSFTTNGNMHRHMRIHEKNFEAINSGILPNGAISKPRRKKMQQRNGSGDASLQQKQAQPTNLSLRITNNNRKRKFADSAIVDSKLPLKKIIWDTEAKNLSATQFVAGKKKHLLLQLPSHKVPEPSPKKVASVNPSSNLSPCSLCNRKFFSNYGLLADLENHEKQQKSDLAVCCTACLVMLKCVAQFKGHMLSVHGAKSTAGSSKSETVSPQEERGAEAKKGTGRNGVLNFGFSDLTAIDFSCQRFPFLAKLFSEKTPRRQPDKNSQTYCSQCEHLFLCEQSLNLHMSEHDLNYPSTCEVCGVAFLTYKHYFDHMLEHEQDVVMSGYTSQTAPVKRDEDVQENISCEEFLLLLGMKATPTASGRESNQSAETSKKCKEQDKALANSSLQVDANQNLVNVTSTGTKPLVAHLEALPFTNDFQNILPQLSAVKLSLGRQTVRNEVCTTETFPKSMIPAFASLKLAPGLLTGQLILPSSSTSTTSSTASEQSATMMETVNIDLPSSIDFPLSNGDHILPRFNESLDSTNNLEDGGRGPPISSDQGSLPFKCSNCPYASTDKSTLLRHLRTHNGERPFQCRICEFAFTTKANCERHVRKKHKLDKRENIENAIGYNRINAESGSEFGAQPLPETVCKFCGKDFKIYRALKHHLRSQTSCQHKPCMCMICNLRFSTKANCMRHLQKKHHNKVIGPVENYMHVNSEMLSDDSTTFHEATPTKKLNNYPKTPLPEVGNIVVSRLLKLKEDMTTKQRPPYLSICEGYCEDGEDSDEPLDFSLKSQKTIRENETAYGSWMLINTSWGSNEEPIDLTVKSPVQQKGHSPCESVNSKSGRDSCRVNLPVTNAETMPLKLFQVKTENVLQLHEKDETLKKGSFEFLSVSPRFHCPHCPLIFRNDAKLAVHLHSHNVEDVVSFPCEHCSTNFSEKAQLDVHLRTKHPQFTDVARSTFVLSSNSKQLNLDKPSQLLPEQNNNVADSINANFLYKPLEKNMSKLSEDDLASVRRILETTSRKQLQPLFSMTTSDDLLSMSPSINSLPSQTDSVISEKTLELDHIDAIAKSIAQSIIVKSDEDDAKRKVDSVCSGSRKQFHDGQDLEQGTDSATKKRRNSYADSPHKLHCNFCPRAFPWISSLKRHILTHTGQKPFRCKQCPVTFSTKSNRERHMIRKHGLDVHDPMTRQTMDRPYKCHLCVFSSFTTSGKLMRHYGMKHPGKEVPENVLTAAGSLSQDEFDSHSRSGNSIGSTGELLTAEQRAEMLENDDEDDDIISSRGTTDDEMNEVEQLTFTLMATNGIIQGKTLAENALPRSLVMAAAAEANIAHLLASSPIKGLFVMGNQNTSGDSSSEIQFNPERDNYNVDKITECWKCKKTFDCRKTLLRHLKEHSIDLPFKCYLCDASFEDRLTSLFHKEEQHPTDWATVQEKNKVSDLTVYADFMESIVRDTLEGKITRQMHEGVELDIKPESDYAQRKVFCTLCPKRFWSLQDLRRHMRSHTGDRPFICDICKTRFTLKHSMMRHRRKHTADANDYEQLCSASDDDSMHQSLSATDGKGLPQSIISGEFPEDSAIQIEHLLPDICTPASSDQKETEVASTKISESAVSSSSNSAGNTSGFFILNKTSSTDNSDLLQSLLGIDDRSTIDRILESPTSAATVLGIQRTKDEGLA